MSEEQALAPRSDLIRPLGSADQVTIPAAGNPGQLRRGSQTAIVSGPVVAIEIIRDQGLPGGGIMIGDRCCAVGEIIAISERPRDNLGRTTLVTDDMMPGLLFEDRALQMIKLGYARPTSKPATVRLGRSQELPGVAEAIEHAMHPAPARAERAVAGRQKAGAI